MLKTLSATQSPAMSPNLSPNMSPTMALLSDLEDEHEHTPGADAGDTPPPENPEQEELPNYSRPERTERRQRRKRSVHKFELKKEGKPAWLTLRLPSLAPSSKVLPAFLGNKPIVGAVYLNLEKPQSLLSIELTVRGRLLQWRQATGIPNKTDLEGFLRIDKVLWKAEEPTRKPSIVDRLTNRDGQELDGEHKFDFSINLPDTVMLPGVSDTEERECHLPPSFSDGISHVTVVYELVVTVKRGSFGSSSQVSTQFTYAPLTRPTNFPPLRQSVYDLGSGQLIGPNEDPSGWTDLDTTIITGRLFNKRDVTVGCTLSLAKPLQYTRGSFIPCCLTIECDDEHALDLLTIPTAPAVELLCLIEVIAHRKHVRRFSIQLDNTALGHKFDVTDKRVASIQAAKWWTSPSSPSTLGRNRRQLFGEIHLRANLTPAFQTPDLKVHYQVGLLPFNTPGFMQDTQAPVNEYTDAIRTIDVDIMTRYAHGHGSVPISVTPPTYKRSKTFRPKAEFAAAFLA